eukprot:gb/GEZN01007846.1/.p1 GENE.gb/GEZN01007846.1/~~gb/GEZN01007846.1/.p1  ORF type:complete len:311 (-),score=1.23 gb/GEZN01007846.1/:563-1453(-)
MLSSVSRALLLFCLALGLRLVSGEIRGSICWGSISCVDNEPYCECSCSNGATSYILNTGSCNACSAEFCNTMDMCSSTVQAQCDKSRCDRYALQDDGECHYIVNTDTGTALYYTLQCTGYTTWVAQYGLSCNVLSEPIEGSNNYCNYVQSPILGTPLLFSVNVNCHSMSTPAIIGMVLGGISLCLCCAYCYRRKRSGQETVVRVNALGPDNAAFFAYQPPGQTAYSNQPPTYSNQPPPSYSVYSNQTPNQSINESASGPTCSSSRPAYGGQQTDTRQNLLTHYPKDAASGFSSSVL